VLAAFWRYVDGEPHKNALKRSWQKNARRFGKKRVALV